MTIVRIAGACLMDLDVRCRYPHRRESERLIMFYDDNVTDPQGDIEAMDRHVAHLEQTMKIQLRDKIHWVRGSSLGQRGLANRGIAIGSTSSPAGDLDRHELAHAVIYQGYDPDTDAPMMLVEGWAQAQSLDTATLAKHAVYWKSYVHDMGARWHDILQQDDGEEFVAEFRRSAVDPVGTMRLFSKVQAEGKIHSFFRELTDPYWYHHDAGIVYHVGGAFVDYMIRRYGAEKFVSLYFSIRPGTFESDIQRIYGIDSATLEKEFWIDAEQQAPMPQKK